MAMPTYEYRCTKGHTFDAVQSMSDHALTVCEVCGAPVQRVLHSPAVHFKGSGFYNTDYGTRNRQREKASADAASSESSATKSSESSESKSAETKTADAKPAAAEKPKAADKAPAKKAD
jgi:putative FmdB family regulatory protein